MSVPDPGDAEVLGALVRLGLVDADARPVLEPLTGGVSSDIFRVDTPDGPICVKRARARLAVEAIWEVDVERNRYEYAWLEVASAIAPSAVPTLLGRDNEAGLFAMSYLDPSDHPVWKAELLAGRADADVAGVVGQTVGRIHARTADSDALAGRFATDALFDDLRLDPYLAATAIAHPDLADDIAAVAEVTRSTRRVLVHGDVSPKNILLGPAGPVLLDAECAWYGDPAFDLAFCANHLVLKGYRRPEQREGYRACFDALVGAYLAEVIWEDPAAIESRAALLLPALLLARVDGKSPVEYLDEDARVEVRAAARMLVADGPSTLSVLADALDQGVDDG